MDPLTAFSLACGVIQVVDFSSQILAKIREISQRGSLGANDEIEHLTRGLDKLNLKLENLDDSGDHAHDSVQTRDQSDLVALGFKCSEIAQQLLAELEELKVPENPRKRQKLAKTWSTIRKKDTIEGLQKKLDTCRSKLDTLVLVDLRNQVHQILMTQSSLRALKDVPEKLLTSFAKKSYSFDQLASALQEESQSTRDFISQKFSQLERSTADRKYENDFLSSLHFPEITRRQEEIKDAHKETFQWLFDKSGRKVRPWSNFMQWLQFGSGIYWINGKPGSGKSTLMNYICQDARTEEALTAWANNRKLLIPTFFFWAAGINLQKTVIGLLRSLIYQILKGNPSLIALTSSKIVSQQLCPTSAEISEPLTTWTEKRLRNYFLALMTSITTSYCVCIFIDGLDEFHGDRDELIDIISGMSQYPGVKCCLSSRPDKPFCEAFGQCSMLKLQDLTRQDIEEYIKARLRNLPQLKRLPVEDNEARQDLFNELTAKAQGVFLWVELAVKSQINGIKYDDSFKTLVQRLLALPIEVEGLYVNMLKRIDPFYRQEVAKHITFTKISHQYYQEAGQFIRGADGEDVTAAVNKRRFPLSIFDHVLATHCLDDDLRVKEQKFKTSTIVSKCEKTNDRIISISEGFLEVSDSPKHELEALEELERLNRNDTWTAWEQDPVIREQFKYDWRSRKVSFCHRTVLDFFTLKDGAGASFLERHSPKISSPRFLMAALELAKLKLCNLVEPFEYICFHVSHIMSIFHLSLGDCDAPDDICWVNFLNYLDRSIALLDQQFNNVLDGSHWCTRLHVQDMHITTVPLHPSQSRASIAVLESHLPNDFLGLAARFKIVPYVRHALTRPDLVINSERAAHLAFNLVAYTDTPSSLLDSGFSWEYECFQTLDTVSKLVCLGADPDVGLETSIWEAALGFVFMQYLWGDSRPHLQGNINLSQCLKNFLDAGVDSFPTLNFIYPAQVPGGRARLECDPSRLPTICRLLQGHEDPYSLQTLENSRQSDSNTKVTKIRFPADGEDFRPPSRDLLNQEETESRNTAIERLISCPVGMSDEFASKLSALIQDIWVSCTAPSPKFHSRGDLPDPDELSDPETDSEAEKGSNQETDSETKEGSDQKTADSNEDED